jgi:hypothetical protein
LRQKQAFEYKRWTKKRYGYYEKPSTLKRKRKKMAKHWQDRCSSISNFKGSCQNTSHLYIGLKELFARTGTNNSAGH